VTIYHLEHAINIFDFAGSHWLRDRLIDCCACLVVLGHTSKLIYAYGGIALGSG